MRFSLLFLVVFLHACATTDIPANQCPADRQALENCPPLDAVDDPELNAWYDARTRLPPKFEGRDSLELGIEAQIPVQNARAKLLGSSEVEAIRSLTVKIHMVENARHSIDASYYIFQDDLAGRALLGAMCEAVQRGVDLRLMVDSIGSVTLDKTWLRALHSCQIGAGFVRNSTGEVTNRRARVQIFIFNALSKSPITANRRSHDKLLVVDGFVPERAIVITGGRNVSLSYFGILEDGSPNPDTYNDAEILLRPELGVEKESTVGEVAEVYFTLLSLYKNNKYLRSKQFLTGTDLYLDRRKALSRSLSELKSLESLKPHFEAMPDYLETEWREADVRLAHEFANLSNETVVTEAVANLTNNPNSIMYLLEHSREDNRNRSESRVVSPYLFLARYYDKEGNLLLDEAERVLEWLAEDPSRSYEMITNSVLTSDNVPAQAIVDMDMAPRMLLDDDHKEGWLAHAEGSELSAELVGSETWANLVNHPQLKIYETGRLDDAYFGGDKHYGKLHSKYLLGDEVGFIGTANFDYRSRLFNNEMGFFFESPELAQDLIEDFELLKSESYHWGTPEWLDMRRQLMEGKGLKAGAVRNQRKVFNVLRKTKLEYLF
ncbi:phospholipase [Halioglobus maricola]|uniref:Phospholipase n=1 Tax=Halioglobus maricola TaxID=2601894 RepID=A0A5P9NH45_9GAMM|nr:phospholipase D-like domain-containing protein [Halioglobus maricola]QFU74348.1 phospholipase [Halioglobus maricola]